MTHGPVASSIFFKASRICVSCTASDHTPTALTTVDPSVSGSANTDLGHCILLFLLNIKKSTVEDQL